MNAFAEDYFLRGTQTGISNFTDYRWLPDSTIAMAANLRRHLRMKDGETLLDVGCARGYYVKALRMLGIEAHGYDISEWAIANCDPEVKPYVSNYLNGTEYDVITGKDVLEHIAPDELRTLITRLSLFTKRQMFFIVPLAFKPGGDYVHPKEENDKTHINRFTLHDWLVFLQACTPNFTVAGSYRVPGLKPGCYEVENGYGFLSMQRL